jgi:hypothetical protein
MATFFKETKMPENLQEDALHRINTWLDRLEDHTTKLLETFSTDDLEPAQAVAIAGKFIATIARLLELRQQFTNESTNEEEKLLRIIFGHKRENISIEEADIDQ